MAMEHHRGGSELPSLCLSSLSPNGLRQQWSLLQAAFNVETNDKFSAATTTFGYGPPSSPRRTFQAGSCRAGRCNERRTRAVVDDLLQRATCSSDDFRSGSDSTLSRSVTPTPPGIGDKVFSSKLRPSPLSTMATAKTGPWWSWR
nr:hypothetical protein Iba_scaffold57569CG0010 [Ipomoea batatas]